MGKISPQRNAWTRALAILLTVGMGMASCSQVSTPTAGVSDSWSKSAVSTISWKGLVWQIKSGSGLGPNNNTWSASNVFVDTNGWLHLRITNVAGVWNCAELMTTTGLPLGTYQWQVVGALDSLDQNVVFGLFPYGPPAIGVDGTNEIDVEFSRWGSPTGNNAVWTVYPSAGTTLAGQHAFSLSLGGGTYTTSRFTWTKDNVSYWLMGGHQPVGTTANVIQAWVCTPPRGTKVPQQALPLHMNLWLFGPSHAPSNGQPVEVIIKDFSRT